MTHLLKILTAAIILSACFSVAQAADEIHTAKPPKPRSYRHAGVSLAFPKGFSAQAAGEFFDVCRAVKTDKGQTVGSITLSAFPVGPDTTSKQYADSHLADLKSRTSFRELTLTQEANPQLHKLDWAIGRFGYTYRGKSSHVAQLYFIREIKKSALGYAIC